MRASSPLNSLTRAGSYSAGEFFDDGLGRVLHAGVFGRRDLVELHALGLEFAQRLVRRQLGLVALVLARLGKAVAQHLLLFRRQAVPELLADDDDVLREGVVGGRDVFLHLEELVGQDDAVGIFLAVDGLVFQRGVQFAERHRHRVGLQRLEGFEIDRVRDHAQLQPGEILDLRDRAARVGGVAEAEAPIAEADQILLGQRLEHRLAERALGQRFGLLERADDEGEVEQAEILDDAGERGGRRREDFLRAAAHRRLLLHLVAELGGRKFADLQLAAALGRQHLGEFLHAKADGVVGVVEVAPADGAFLHLGGGRCSQKRAKADGSAQQSDPHGGFSPLVRDLLASRWGELFI